MKLSKFLTIKTEKCAINGEYFVIHAPTLPGTIGGAGFGDERSGVGIKVSKKTAKKLANAILKKLSVGAMLAISLGLFGCGLHIDTDPIKVEGTVNHVVQIKTSDLLSVFTDYCNNKYSVQAEIDACVAEETALFWQAIQHTVPPGSVVSDLPTPSPTPSPTPTGGTP